MSGPGRVPNWPHIVRELTKAGCTPTEYGLSLAQRGQPLSAYRLICAYCTKDMGPLPATFTGNSHGICASCEIKQFGHLPPVPPPEAA